MIPPKPKPFSTSAPQASATTIDSTVTYGPAQARPSLDGANTPTLHKLTWTQDSARIRAARIFKARYSLGGLAKPARLHCLRGRRELGNTESRRTRPQSGTSGTCFEIEMSGEHREGGSRAVGKVPSFGKAALVAAGLVVLSLLAFAADDWVCRELYHFPWPSEVHQLIMFGEIFGHGMGVLVLIGVVAVLDTHPRVLVPRLALCAFGSGLVANILKMLLPRMRPHYSYVSEGVLASFDSTEITELADVLDYSLHSFPSAHAATAMGLAVGLAWTYPRGRYLFVGLGALAGLQRLVTGAHFLSDVLAGAAVGVVYAVYAIRWLEARSEASPAVAGWFGRRWTTTARHA